MSLFTQFVSLFRDNNQRCSCSSTASLLPESLPIGNGLSRRRICKHQSWKAFTACSIHILPLVFTVAILFVNLATTYFEDIGVPSQDLRLNALQFGAKLHEILIAASLSLVAINYIQYELLVGRGLPLSSVLAGFQITALSSVISSRPWEKKLFIKGYRHRRIRFIAILILLVILCAITGPSSAILILPATGLWKLPLRLYLGVGGSFVTDWGDSELHFFLNANESTLWPSFITLTTFPESMCNFKNTTISDPCPAGGYSFLESAFDQIDFHDDNMYYSWNITIPLLPKVLNSSEQVYERYLEGAYDLSSSSVTWTTMASVDRALADTVPPFSDIATVKDFRWEISRPNGEQIFGPQTFVLCIENSVGLENDSTFAIIPDQLQQLTYPVRDGRNWTTDSDDLLSLMNQSRSDASFWVQPYDFGDHTPSIAAAFAAVDKEFMEIAIQTCSVYSSWEPVEVLLEPATDETFHSPTIDNGIRSHSLFDLLRRRNTKSIQLDIAWANSALPCNETIGRLTKSQLSVPSLDGWYFGYALSLVVTDALARVEMDIGETLALDFTTTNDAVDFEAEYGIAVKNNSEIDSGIFTAIDISSTHFGYGYSTNGITRRLAIGVLLLHILIAIIHTALVLWYGWTCTDLGSIYDLVILAIRASTVLSEDPSLPPVTLAELKKQNVDIELQHVNGSELKLVVGKHLGSTSLANGEEGELLDLADQTSMSDQNGLATGCSRTSPAQSR